MRTHLYKINAFNLMFSGVLPDCVYFWFLNDQVNLWLDIARDDGYMGSIALRRDLLTEINVWVLVWVFEFLYSINANKYG